VVPEDSEIKGKADIDGKTISCQTGTTAELYCQKNDLKNSAFAANADAEMALTTGKVDVWAIDKLTAIDMVAEYNESNDDKLVVLEEPLTYEPYGFASKLGNNALIEAINGALQELIADGTVKGLFETYEAEYVDPSVDPTV
jgi:polar amino acid transport system substrate-binding protein